MTSDNKEKVFVEELEIKLQEANDHTSEDRGAQFEYVVAQKIAETEEGQWEEDLTGRDNCVGEWGGGKDMGCDLWFENQTDKRILIVQCKYSEDYNKALTKNHVDSFFTIWQQLEDKVYVHENANDNLKKRLTDFSQKLSLIHI